MNLFGQKWLYSRKSGSIRAEVVLFRQTMWFYLGNVVVFGQKFLHSGKSGYIRQKWLYSDNVVVFGPPCCIREKVDVFGQN